MGLVTQIVWNTDTVVKVWNTDTLKIVWNTDTLEMVWNTDIIWDFKPLVGTNHQTEIRLRKWLYSFEITLEINWKNFATQEKWYIARKIFVKFDKITICVVKNQNEQKQCESQSSFNVFFFFNGWNTDTLLILM